MDQKSWMHFSHNLDRTNQGYGVYEKLISEMILLDESRLKKCIVCTFEEGLLTSDLLVTDIF